jgi:CTP:molybdopterin cytidylyltransferase MocA
MSIEAAPHVLVLAAGSGSRFGSPKQLVRIGGEALLQRAVSRATALGGHAVTVVLGAHAGELTPMLRHSSATVLINRHWQEGLASSLRLGIAHLPPGTEAVLVTLADQAAITGFDLRRLASAWRRQTDSVVAASYDGHTGVPAIFPAHAFGLLQELRGDVGARAVLSHLADRVLRVPMPNASIDIDVPEDLLKLEPGAPGV